MQSLKEFYDKFEPLVDNAYQNMEKMDPEKIGELCPDCGGELVIRQGRFGKFTVSYTHLADPYALLTQIAVARKHLNKQGEADLTRTIDMVINEIRNDKLGPISWERPA